MTAEENLGDRLVWFGEVDHASSILPYPPRLDISHTHTHRATLGLPWTMTLGYSEL